MPNNGHTSGFEINKRCSVGKDHFSEHRDYEIMFSDTISPVELRVYVSQLFTITFMLRISDFDTTYLSTLLGD